MTSSPLPPPPGSADGGYALDLRDRVAWELRARLRQRASGRRGPLAPVLAGVTGPFAFFRHRIVGRIVLPYLVLVAFFGIFLLFLTNHLIASSLEDNFRNELLAAGRSAGEAMVKVEERHLTALRAMSFTVGVDQAIANRDVDALRPRLAPLMLSHRVAYVDVFTPTGGELLALRGRELGPEAASRVDPDAPNWAPVREVLAGRFDALGDKRAGVVETPWGPMFVVATPVYRGSELVGAISTGQPLEQVASTLSSEVGSKPITLYRPDGQVLVSTVRSSAERLASDLGLSPELSAEFGGSTLSRDQVLIRRANVDDRSYVESLGVLLVRRQPTLLLGVGTPVGVISQRMGEAGGVIILFSLIGILLAFIIGYWVARSISRPIRTLVDATVRIQDNDLAFTVPVQTQDEIGVLSESMNETIKGLRERDLSQRAIESYMSPKVYRLIQDDRLELGGLPREITVFKTDIRDFTALSETMDAPALIKFLNRYFERMVGAVTRYNGEVDKYMGDSILAKFGATEADAWHARHAVVAMVEMIEQCEALNIELEQEGQPRIRMGIGANTGMAVVGNLGAKERMEYTIISEAVNLAQRIEELCKPLAWDLLISDSVYQQTTDVIEVGLPWDVPIRGISRPVRIYPVLGVIGEVRYERRRAYYELLAREEEQAGRAQVTA